MSPLARERANRSNYARFKRNSSKTFTDNWGKREIDEFAGQSFPLPERTARVLRSILLSRLQTVGKQWLIFSKGIMFMALTGILRGYHMYPKFTRG
ncbi:MAG: hypothetical protein A4E63_02853 [Syntrophorhabdus sp. PtaU1.Bin050]|nr:MAG: hypothetical protein A4E63_02853 [Syntrophorhabdus sp. PtaU1.Bin050]